MLRFAVLTALFAEYNDNLQPEVGTQFSEPLLPSILAGYCNSAEPESYQSQYSVGTGREWCGTAGFEEGNSSSDSAPLVEIQLE